MSLAEKDSETSLKIGGTKYALKKLRRWKDEGPTERKKQMVRFLLDNGNFANSYSRNLTSEASALIDLALGWGDLAIWQEVLKKSASGRSQPQLDSDVLIRAWSVFAFDQTKNLSVHFDFCVIPCSSSTL